MRFLIVSIIVLLIFMPTTLVKMQETPVFSNIKVSNNNFYLHQVEPTMVLGSNHEVFIGYKEALTYNGGGYAVSFTKSLDGGETWSQPYLMPSHRGNTSRQSDVWMDYLNGTLYYAYLDFDSLSSASQVTLAISTNNGDNWTLARASNNDGFSDKETMTVDPEGNIYIAYDDVFSATYFSLSRSFDNATTFVENTTWADDGFGDGLGPFILASKKIPGLLYLAYTYLSYPDQSDILFDFSWNYGETWQKDMEPNKLWNASTFVNYGGGPSLVTLPVLAEADNGRLYLLWDDAHLGLNPINFDVWLAYSDDFGITWSDPIQVNPNSNGNQWSPAMDVDKYGNAHIVYYDNSSGSYDVYYRVYNAQTNQFTKEIRVSQQSTPGNMTRPGEYMSVKIDKDGYSHVVWADGRNGDMDIYYGKSQTTLVPEPTTNSSSPTSSPASSTSSATTTSSSATSTSSQSLTSTTEKSPFPLIPATLIMALIIIKRRR